ncbi:MAG: hypothetical protein ABI337_01445 [Nitrososphaera sp.]|jgi:site-specific recombinase XerD
MTEINKYVLRDFVDYRRENGTNHKTIGYDFAVLSTFYGFLVFVGYSTTNHVMVIKKRYLKSYKTAREESRRKIISVEQMSMLIQY